MELYQHSGKCIDRLGRLVECEALPGNYLYYNVEVIDNKVFWNNMYIGELDPVRGVVGRWIYDSLFKEIRFIPLGVPARGEEVEILSDGTVISRPTGRIIGRAIGRKVLEV